MVQDKKIGAYGITSNEAFILDPMTLGLRDHTPISDINPNQLPYIVELAQQCKGKDHHFRFMQNPFN